MSEPDLAIRLRTYSDQLGGITDEAADEIDRLRVKHQNQSSFIKEFHSCLNGIEHIRCIPGASIDGCWDAKAIREVVMVLVANCTRTWKDNWRGSEKGVSENARMHNEACDSERKRCEHRIVESFGLPTPSVSRCWFCPHQRNAEWRDVRDNYPELWEAACREDDEQREQDLFRGGLGVWLHHSRIPLREADIETDEEIKTVRQCSLGACFV